MKTYLVPHDFSTNAGTALSYALQLSAVTGARLFVFHCFSPPFSSLVEKKPEAEQAALSESDMARLFKELERQVDNACKGLGIERTNPVDIHVEMSPFVVEKIIEVARMNEAELIIMGTHGATGFTRRLFGSNTSNTITKSDIPVLAIPMDWSFEKIQTVAMATDLDDFVYELEELVSLVAPLNSNIDIIYLDYGIDPYKEKEFKATRVVKEHSYKRIRFTRQTASMESSLLTQLNAYLDEVEPQWLAMFTREQKFWSKLLLLSKTEDLVNSCRLPVLSFKKRMVTAA